jgi:hypothetical protein
VGQLEKVSGSGDIFPIVMSALVKAIDENGESVDQHQRKLQHSIENTQVI